MRVSKHSIGTQGVHVLRVSLRVSILGSTIFLPGAGSCHAAEPLRETAFLTAPSGTTAISGRIFDAAGKALSGVRVVDNATVTHTDPQGRFLLAPVPIGKSVVQIDARRTGFGKAVDYGFHEILAYAQSGKTMPLGFTSWLTPIDHSTDITIASPTQTEITLSTPSIPGLEIHIAPNTVIKDAEGHVVTKIGLTALPPGHQPIGLPEHISMPLAFTVQPGAACLYSSTGGVSYAKIIYPNLTHLLPRARTSLFRYEPDANGWRIYGAGTVSNDGSQIIPDKDAVVTDFGSAECDEQTKSHTLIIKKPTPAGQLFHE